MTSAASEDPYLWLEDVDGAKALAWAEQQNKRTMAALGQDPRFAPLKQRILTILDSQERVPWVGKRGRYYYNFWQDQDHVRGIWRRIKGLAEYKKAKPAWETVLDIDALGAADGQSWVFQGATCLYPKMERCLVTLSPGGGDATVIREFDTRTKAFVEGGFTVPKAKTNVAWKDLNTVYIGTDFGPGSLTSSGYPRIVKEWRRGTPLSEASTVFEGKTEDMSVWAHRIWDHGKVYDIVVRRPSFFTGQYWLVQDKKMVPIEIPESATMGTWDGQLLVTLREDWRIGEVTWPKGSLLTTSFVDFMAGKREFLPLFTPAANKSLADYTLLKTAIVVNELEDVKNRLYQWRRQGGKWQRTALQEGTIGSFSLGAVETYDADEYWLFTRDFTRPYALSMGAVGKQPEPLKQDPTFFDADGLTVSQHFATSKDGTKIPYFQVSRGDMTTDEDNPTLLYGYGGFEVSLEPQYMPVTGAAWLERGGVYVQANIRGGGEYGPAWHQAALKHDRQRAYDDFAAVAEDLIARGVTRPKRLGIMGGSNGGLLVGVMVTQRPELFGAAVCQVPLLDMKRYSQLLAGASWMAEYGDPDNAEDWAAIAKYSPYHNVKPGKTYPPVLFTTSTKDDRVHPGHARKMVARMLEFGDDVLYYENIEGGHAGAADHEQSAHMRALEYTFLADKLGLK